MNKEIWVIIEHSDSEIKSISKESVQGALKLKTELNGNLIAVVCCGNETPMDQAVSALPVDEVIQLKNENLQTYTHSAYLTALTPIIKERNPYAILLGATNHGKELAAGLAGEFNCGLATDCIALSYDASRGLTVKRPIYAGKAISTLVFKGDGPHIATLRPNIFRTEDQDAGSPTKIQNIDVDSIQESQLRSILKEIRKETGKTLDITEARIIISGGMGMQGPENFKLLEELAEVTGGAVGASRPVVDNGWRNYSNQVGQTGRTVSPDLYIACGISGAVQHLAGMSSSRCIVAINNDPNAPIFDVCDYGIIGDVLQVLPVLTQEIKKIIGK